MNVVFLKNSQTFHDYCVFLSSSTSKWQNRHDFQTCHQFKPLAQSCQRPKMLWPWPSPPPGLWQIKNSQNTLFCHFHKSDLPSTKQNIPNIAHHFLPPDFEHLEARDLSLFSGEEFCCQYSVVHTKPKKISSGRYLHIQSFFCGTAQMRGSISERLLPKILQYCLWIYSMLLTFCQRAVFL